MNITITSKKVTVTPAFKEKVEKKLKKLSKFFHDEPTAQVTLSTERDHLVMETTVHVSGMIYRAKHAGYDLNESIDRIVDVIERQIRKNKTRLEKRHKVKKDAFLLASDDFIPDIFEEIPEDSFKVVKIKRFDLKPMDVEEAILQMNLLGHQFFVFLNVETCDKNIVYKRADGNYAIIEI